MKKLRKGIVWVLAGVFCLVLLGPAFSQEAAQPMTAEQLVASISQKWSNLQDFQGDMTIAMQMFGTMMKIGGTMWQKGKLFRMEMTLPPELMGAGGNKSTEPAKILLVFDGKTMWQSIPMMNMVMKTDFSALEGMKDMSFGKTPYSLPALSYKLSEKKRNGNDYYFLETGDVVPFIQKSGMSGMGVNLPANMPFQSIGLWVNKTSLFTDLIEFYFQGSAAPGMYLEFKNIKTDRGLSPDLFTFKTPEGAQVMDMTEATKKIIQKMKQSTAPDTAQAPAKAAAPPQK